MKKSMKAIRGALHKGEEVKHHKIILIALHRIEQYGLSQNNWTTRFQVDRKWFEARIVGFDLEIRYAKYGGLWVMMSVEEAKKLQDRYAARLTEIQ